MRHTRFVFSFVLSALFLFPSAAQQTATASTQAQASDPQAITVLTNSSAAMTGIASLTDTTLQGTAERIAGSDDETGTAVLKATSDGNSRVDLTLPAGSRSEVRTNPAGGPVGNWSGPDGVWHDISYHNLLTDSSWFFPAFTVARLLSSQTYVLSYVGQETRNGQSVVRVTASQPTTVTGIPADQAALLQHLTQMDIFLDSATLLPAALSFNTHPDNNALLDIPVEIRFSNYQIVNGVQVPFHVQKYLNNTLLLDFQAQSVTLNSGLTASSFSL